MPVAIGYAIWAAAGIAIITLAAKIIWNDPLTPIMGIGFVLIIGGVVLVELGSKVHA
jgi:small multidrug resistance pump